MTLAAGPAHGQRGGHLPIIHSSGGGKLPRLPRQQTHRNRAARRFAKSCPHRALLRNPRGPRRLYRLFRTAERVPRPTLAWAGACVRQHATAAVSIAPNIRGKAARTPRTYRDTLSSGSEFERTAVRLLAGRSGLRTRSQPLAVMRNS